MIFGAGQVDGFEERDYVGRIALVDAFTGRYDVNVVQHFEYGGAGLVYRADDGLALVRHSGQ